MTWTVYYPGEPIRCPSVLSGGRRCNRAQDKAGERVTVYVRKATHSTHGIARVCRSCNTSLEIVTRTPTEDPPA